MSKITIKLDDKTFSAFVSKPCANTLFLKLCHAAMWNPQGVEDHEEMNLSPDEAKNASDTETAETMSDIPVAESDHAADRAPLPEQKKNSAPVHISHEQDMRKEKTERYKGFLHLVCEKCGKNIAINAKRLLSEFVCHTCGATTPLENLAPMRLTCECGKKWHYLTNSYDEMLEVDCLACGSPMTAELNDDGEYETLRNRS